MDVNRYNTLPSAIKDFIATILENSLQLSPEAITEAVVFLRCCHLDKSEVCHFCARPWDTNHCSARDPAKRIQCNNCVFFQLA
jgi:hypothetical protein